MDRLQMGGNMTAETAERRSDPPDMPDHHQRAAQAAKAAFQAAHDAFDAIRDDKQITEILDDVRDRETNEGRCIEFDGQLARLLREFPTASRALAAMPGNAPEPVRIALEAMLQAISRIERLLYNEAYADELAAMDADQ